MDLLKIKEEFQNCSCGQEHTCPIETVEIGSGALRSLQNLCSEYNNILIVSDDNTFRACGETVLELLSEKVEKNLVLHSAGKVIIPNEGSIATIEEALSSKTDLIVGVGSGVINDLCKYVSFFHNLPYFIVATATSMDGYASVGAAMILDGMKVTVTTRPPKAIIADTAVLKSAPLKMLQAGYGDIVGKYSCLNDWKLSALVNEEHFCQKIFDHMLVCTNEVKCLAEGILKRDEKTLGTLMEALVTVGVLMCFVGSSRPASGSEHHLSHFFEITGILNGAPYFDHGIDVLYSAYYTQLLREELIEIDDIYPVAILENAGYERQIKRIYNKLAPEVLSLQNKLGWIRLDRFPVYCEKWAAIKKLLSETPSSSKMKEYISAIGLDLREFEEMYGQAKIKDAIFFAKDLKDRYSVLWLYFAIKYVDY